MKNVNGINVFESFREIVDPAHTCVVVWDVQNGLVDRIFNKDEFMAALKPSGTQKIDDTGSAGSARIGASGFY
jgi:hypothetical protein